ncbi:MAG: hypothetical protein ACMG6S_03510, partial [Byssovorax sp.]
GLRNMRRHWFRRTVHLEDGLFIFSKMDSLSSRRWKPVDFDQLFEFSGVNFGAGGRLREDALSSAARA